MQNSTPLRDRIIISFADSMLQSIIILLFCLAILLSRFTKDPRLIYAMYLPFAVGLLQLISAVVRTSNSNMGILRKLLRFYWVGVWIVFSMIGWMYFDNYTLLAYLLAILSAILGIYYCCLSWYHSLYLAKKNNHDK